MRYRYNPATDEVEPVVAAPIVRPPSWTKPLHCEALGCEPDEVPQWKEFDRQMGLGDVEYDSAGCPVFNDQGTYDRYVRAHGYYNKTSGKGNQTLDPTLLKRIQERFANSA